MQNKMLIRSGIALGAICVVLTLYAPVMTYNTVIPESDQVYYQSLNLQLSSNAEPGNSDEYDSDSFSIHLVRGQNLYFSFYAEGAPVMLRVITPSEEALGYMTSNGEAGNIEDKGLGKLQKGKVLSTMEGHLQFVAMEEGLYTFNLKSAAPKADIDVTIEYKIT
jgi:hypothetical protein